MILGGRLRVAVDIVDEREIEKLSRNPRALRRTFTDRELAECAARGEDRIAALARRFAVKEALMKACGEPAGVPARIEIVHDPSGAPKARWDYLSKNGLEAEVSASSSAGLAVAVAVVCSP